MSFLGSLASIATSFIPGVGPFLAPVVGGLVGSIGGNAAAKTIAGPSNDQKQSFNLLNSAAETGIGAGKDQLSAGNAIINRGLGTLSAPSSYFQAILNGGGAATEALAPDIARIKGANATTFNTAANLSSRGGGRSSVLFNAPFRDESQINALQSQLKAPAAEGLTRIGQIEAGTGTQVAGQAAPLMGTGVAAARGAGDMANQFQRQQAGTAEDIGTLLARLLAGGGGGKTGGGGGGLIGGLFDLFKQKPGPAYNDPLLRTPGFANSTIDTTQIPFGIGGKP